ncbi:GGDEF domain-containing protein [Aquipuribacter sp. MA13-6]|uniref:GGDEF domain-containing protein n=1 Tax=unclassified Aquipuribacter TaxID=2635084 RepID=UPI003EEBE296
MTDSDRRVVGRHDHPQPFTGIRSTWGDGLLIAIAGLMLLYWTYVVIHLLDEQDEHNVVLAWVDGLSGVAAVVVLALLALLRPDRGGRLLLTALLSTAAAANAVAHLWVSQDLVNTVLVVIVLLVVAAGITSSPVAAGLVAALWLGWFAATSGQVSDPDWTRHLSDVAVATLAGLMLHVGRRMTMLKLLRAQAELERLTEHDDLTGLANRRGFFAVMRRALTQAERGGGRRLVVLYCDVDGLKLVNDTRGHEAGDALLVSVADRLRAEFSDAEVVARLGGDEFGVVLLTADGADAPAEAAARARRVRDDTVDAVWSLSVGAASSDELRRPPPAGPGGRPPGPGGTWPGPDLVGAVVGLADERMYEAKRSRPERPRP